MYYSHVLYIFSNDHYIPVTIYSFYFFETQFPTTKFSQLQNMFSPSNNRNITPLYSITANVIEKMNNDL